MRVPALHAGALLLIASFVPNSAAQEHPAPLNGPEIKRLFDGEEFAALERIADENRRSKQRNSQGDWQLYRLYTLLSIHSESLIAESETQFRNRLRAWEREFPDSVTWRIVLADGLVEIGWNARGDGLAYTVTPQGWLNFEKYLTEAWKVLQDAKKLSTADPELFSTLMTIGMGLGEDPTAPAGGLSLIRESIKQAFGADAVPDKAIHDVIFDEARKHEALYPPLYWNYAIAVLPRWGGAPGEVEAFAARAADLTRADAGDTYYAVVALAILDYTAEEGYVLDHRFEWPRIKSGLDRILDDYPDANRWANYATRLACAHEDRDAAAAYRAKITEPVPDRWYAANRMATFFAWIDGGPYPSAGILRGPINDDDTDRLKKLLEGGIDPNAIDYAGYTPVMTAIHWEKAECLRILLEAGGDPQHPTPRGNTPLTEACHKDISELIELCLDHGADPDRPNQTGWRPLHTSVREDKRVAVQTLLDGGADVNIAMPLGWTPIHVAAEKNRVEVAGMLLKRGADVSAKLDDGRTALEIAKYHKFQEMVALLTEAGKTTTP
jgi:hypothetical protein